MEITERDLYEHGLEVAYNAYRAARYRGQFNGDKLGQTKRNAIKRNYDEWWKQHYGEIPDKESATVTFGEVE